MNEINIENTKDEMIIIVDENDFPLYNDTRKNMVIYFVKLRDRKISLIDQLTYLNRFAVQKRSIKKEYCPGYLDLSSGGVVNSGDNDIKSSAIRELLEEIGVDAEDIEYIGKKFYKDNVVSVFNYIYLYKYDGQFTFNDGEVDEIIYLTKGEILDKIKNNEKITPDSIGSFNFLLNEKENLFIK